MASGIYIIHNKVTGKNYIGSAVDIKQRWRKHRFLLRNGEHHSKHLQNAYDKFGESNLEFKVLEYVKDSFLLTEREQEWIDKYRVCDREYGYNVSTHAESTIGYKHTEESKEKMRTIRKKYQGAKHPMYGKQHTEETKQKISENRKGKLTGNDHFMFGKHLSDESKQKISEKKTGSEMSVEAKKKMSLSHTGAHIGGKNNNAVLTDEKVKEIKIALRDGVSATTLSKQYSVSIPTISMIKRNRTWTHVQI